MGVVNGYIAVPALKAVLRDTRAVDDVAYERAIGAASRRIDDYTGRQFWRTTGVEPRLFRASTRFVVRCGDFADTGGMTVEAADPAGVFSPLASAAWQPEPHHRDDGHPYTTITSTGGLLGFPVSGRIPRVQVTARWGWESVPDPVAQACQILAVVYVKTRDLSAGTAGFESDSARPDDLTAQAEALLARYRDPSRARADSASTAPATSRRTA